MSLCAFEKDLFCFCKGKKECLRKKNCPHENKRTRVLKATATCETSQEYCPDCKKYWKPKTECL